MAEYKGIKGFKVQSLASDPPVGIEGQVWYNTAGYALKYTAKLGAWSSAAVLLTDVYTAGFAGIQTAGILFGGDARTAGPPQIATTQIYDGTSWTVGNDMVDTTKHQASAGTSTAALSICGFHPGSKLCESYNGTSWTDSASTNTARSYAGGGGIQTAALTYGGPQLNPGMHAATEQWNATSWTAVANLNTPTSLGCGDGTTTSSLYCGGYQNGGTLGTTKTETWDGTSWTENTGALNQATIDMGGAGNATLFLSFGGNIPPPSPTPGKTSTTEEWNGTSWTELGDMATARSFYNAGGGTTTTAIGCGGEPNDSTGSLVEEWNVAPATKTVTTS